MHESLWIVEIDLLYWLDNRGGELPSGLLTVNVRSAIVVQCVGTGRSSALAPTSRQPKGDAELSVILSFKGLSQESGPQSGTWPARPTDRLRQTGRN